MEKGMATHPSILVWRIPWWATQSMGSQELDRIQRLNRHQRTKDPLNENKPKCQVKLSTNVLNAPLTKKTISKATHMRSFCLGRCLGARGQRQNPVHTGGRALPQKRTHPQLCKGRSSEIRGRRHSPHAHKEKAVKPAYLDFGTEWKG